MLWQHPRNPARMKLVRTSLGAGRRESTLVSSGLNVRSWTATTAALQFLQDTSMSFGRQLQPLAGRFAESGKRGHGEPALAVVTQLSPFDTGSAPSRTTRNNQHFQAFRRHQGPRFFHVSLACQQRESFDPGCTQRV
jgi:hypothetical protein